jgi:hypothetical protein
MKNNIGLLFIFCFMISFTQTVAQIKDDQIHYNSERLSRFRLSLGYVNLLYDDSNFEFRHFFLNLSFRSSGFNRNSDAFKIKFAFEPGVNGLIISNDYANDFNLYLTPYAKFGPEIKMGQNLFLGASLGLVLVTFESRFFPLPFLGMNGFYLFELNENFSVELESGFHTTFSPDKLPYLVYISAGISII